MERRDLLKLSLAAGLGSTACAPRLPLPSSASDEGQLPDLAEHLERMDRDLTLIGQLGKFTHLTLPSDPLGRRKGPLTIDLNSDPRMGAAQMAQAARSLYLVGTFHDLPLEAQLHPEVQRRMAAAAPAIADSAMAMVDYLRGQTPKELEQLKGALRTSPDLVHQLCSLFDQTAQHTEVDNSKRKRLRGVANQLSWRLEKQSPSSVIGEYLDKAERLFARASRRDETAPALATVLADSGMHPEQVERILARWRDQGPLEGSGDDAPPEFAPPPPFFPVDAGAPPSKPAPAPAPQGDSTAKTAAKVGAVGAVGVGTAGGGLAIFGIALAALGVIGGIVGVVLLASGASAVATAGLVLTTLGGVVLVLGLLIALIGAVVLGGAAVVGATSGAVIAHENNKSKANAEAAHPAPTVDPRQAPPPPQAEPPH